MLAKKFRFHGHHSLDYTYRQGKTVRSPVMSLRYTQSKGSNFRIAVVVSKKVSKSAAVRNKIRRRVYEAIRTIDIEIPLPKNDMIVSVFDEKVATLPPATLKETLLKLIAKTAHK